MKYLFLLLFMIFMFPCTSGAQGSLNINISEQDQSGGTIIFMEVRSLTNLTSIEKEKVGDALAELKAEKARKVSVSDARTRVTYTRNSQTGEINIESRKKNKESLIEKDAEIIEYHFGAVDETPIFPGCEDLNSEEKRKKCTIGKLQEFVRNNFDREIKKKIDFPGQYRTYVEFQIKPDGSVHILDIVAPHPVISEEMEVVLNELPDMVPGEHHDKVIPVVYSFPFIFNVDP